MGKIDVKKKLKKEALFNTAFELFTTKGLSDTTISDIVNRAGVAKGTFYLYFKDKYDIRNKLVSHKTRDLFFSAHEALHETDLTGFEDQLRFIFDYIIGKLEENRSLLMFISKNLSWGVFCSALEETTDEDDYPFYRYYQALLEKSGKTYCNEELMLFTIIELVSSTCYSCILYEQPVSMESYRPYLYRAIHGILNSYEMTNK